MYKVDVPRVRGKMAERGYNITTLARELGVSRNTLASYLSNSSSIPYDKLSKLAELICDDSCEAASIFFKQDLRFTKGNTKKGVCNETTYSRR